MNTGQSTNVISQVVSQNLCCGCGVCAGVCPRGHLEIRFNEYGEYVPFPVAGTACGDNCCLCLEVCPFTNAGPNEDALAQERYATPDIRHDPVLGYFRKILVGWCTNHQRRIESASGGLATWYLQRMLEKGDVDAVACVLPCTDGTAFYRYGLVNRPADMIQSAKSCYYPVELSQVVKHLLTIEGRYGIIGLPCFIKALRRAARKLPVLNQRLVHTAGLVCGQQKSAFFAEYICALVGGDPRRMKTIRFRTKDPSRPASDYGYRIEFEGDTSREIFWTQGINKAWCEGYFKLNACDYCDDVFAETADVAFMDAWADPWMRDWRGTNFVVARTPYACSTFETGARAGNICVQDVSVVTICASQAGVIQHKRSLLPQRLWIAAGSRGLLPKKRLSPTRSRWLVSQEIRLQQRIASTTRHQWRKIRLQQENQASRLRARLAVYSRLLGGVRFLKKVQQWVQHLTRGVCL